MVRLSDVLGPDGSLKPSSKGTEKAPQGKTAPQETIPPLAEPERGEASLIYQEAIEWVTKKFKETESGSIAEISGGMEIAGKMVKILTGGGESLLTLAATPKEGYHLYSHCVNVSILSIKVGLGLHYRPQELIQLGVAALIHDVGMAKVPRELVEKRGGLSEEELAIVKKHPIYTVELLEGTKGLDRTMLDAILHEHERIDGTGYPAGLQGEQLSEFGSTIAIVDVYEALTHPRPYRKRYTQDEAMKMIAYSMGNQFKGEHVRILKALVKELSIYPVGSFIQLNTKEIGQVVRVNKNFPLLPVIDVWLDASGDRLPEIKRVNLAQEPLLHIKKSVDILEAAKDKTWLNTT
ncbi:MAG: HD-GYP domain-containing protein [Candidatus Omnitrophica bacterium]|nr:HD-GYP domain-containing protein [Candidatus Omnitrophota bacterium]